MTTPIDLRMRIASAKPIVSELRGLVLREASPGNRMPWTSILNTVSDILETDDDPAEVLKYAGRAFDRLYNGGRSFCDFMIYRSNLRERAAENQRLEKLTTTLRQLLHCG